MPAGVTAGNQPEAKPSQVISQPVDWHSYRLLLVINLLMVVLIWAFLLISNLLAMEWLFASIVWGLSPSIWGLLVCMIVWNRSIIRAYAIGALFNLFILSVASAFIYYWEFNYAWSGTIGQPSEPTRFLISEGMRFTLVAFGGMLTATYVQLLLWFQASSRLEWELPVEQTPTEKSWSDKLD